MKSNLNVPHQKYVLKNNDDNDCINSNDEVLIYNNEMKINKNKKEENFVIESKNHLKESMDDRDKNFKPNQ